MRCTIWIQRFVIKLRLPPLTINRKVNCPIIATLKNTNDHFFNNEDLILSLSFLHHKYQIRDPNAWCGPSVGIKEEVRSRCTNLDNKWFSAYTSTTGSNFCDVTNFNLHNWMHGLLGNSFQLGENQIYHLCCYFQNVIKASLNAMLDWLHVIFLF